MADRLTKEQRSALMARVRSENTGLEEKVFALLEAHGLGGFERHARELPGTPDAVWRRSRVALFVNGDFWHGWNFPRWRHKLSQSWREKIERNRDRDERVRLMLRDMGWAVVKVWEHELDSEAGILRFLAKAHRALERT